MLFGPFDFLLALPTRRQDRAQVLVGISLVVAGVWSIFVATNAQQVIEGACGAVIGACFAGLGCMDIRDRRDKKSD